MRNACGEVGGCEMCRADGGARCVNCSCTGAPVDSASINISACAGKVSDSEVLVFNNCFRGVLESVACT